MVLQEVKDESVVVLFQNYGMLWQRAQDLCVILTVQVSRDSWFVVLSWPIPIFSTSNIHPRGIVVQYTHVGSLLGYVCRVVRYHRYDMSVGTYIIYVRYHPTIWSLAISEPMYYGT